MTTLDGCTNTFLLLLQTLLARAVFQTISVGLTDTREKVVSMALALLDQVVSKLFSFFHLFICHRYSHGDFGT